MSLADLRIEPFKPKDLDAMMEIENRSFTLPWSRQFYEQLWSQEAIDIWVGRRGRELVAYYLIQTVGDEMELHTFAVKPELRRQGIGEKLMQHMISEAKRRGVRQIYLQVRPSNAEAIGLYQKLGFVSIAVRRAYYRDNNEDAVVMRLDVEASA
ncbi:MAG: ribosomal protein S18-alanine N-acetyltransferase [Pseudomonadota bacterium]